MSHFLKNTYSLKRIPRNCAFNIFILKYILLKKVLFHYFIFSHSFIVRNEVHSYFILVFSFSRMELSCFKQWIIFLVFLSFRMLPMLPSLSSSHLFLFYVHHLEKAFAYIIRTISVKYFTVAWPDSGTRIWMVYTMSIHKNHFKQQKYGTESV